MDPTDLEASSRISLQGPGDWKRWISIIQKFSIAQNVWQYIDPFEEDKPALAKPAGKEKEVERARSGLLCSCGGGGYRTAYRGARPVTARLTGR
jgi:hypothetical protein